MGILLGDLLMRDIDLKQISRLWTQEFRRRRDEAADHRYYILCHAQELTRQMDVLADCGLQSDIRSHIQGNRLSFNRNWVDSIDRTKPIMRWIFDAEDLNDPHAALAAQLKVLFGKHRISRYAITLIQCDQHDYIVFLEAHREKESIFEIAECSDISLIAECTIIYLALLKRSQLRSASDWEKAVHELVSPLDFIYSNADFFTNYLTRADVKDELKLKKLEDFRLISRLLINRLHQFRFAFAGLPEGNLKVNEINLYKLCMPITHLWHHEARRKNLRFVYDDLKHIDNIWSDEELLQFVLFNLVSNAIKYSSRGTEIGLYARNNGKLFVVGIRNQGIVIPEEEGFLIFESGYRTEEARRVDSRGMGIGLGVCRQLMLRLKGKISLTKSDQTETIFEIEAPLLK
ncbi:MAG TPA: hypothetical protein DCZ94_03205 [Lentisphaeria bacterium]|nr:MAG: hypothetical protein A2X48_03405 [Lentisphaerae bacterium GWF2_49_21]HBC85942.1 hypothetical protein [Lentisphaeria bacterium]